MKTRTGLASALVLSFLAFHSVSAWASTTLRFPGNFRWCVATSAHQIEGYNYDSDWWEWEQIPGKIKNGDKSGDACDHWNRLEEDVQLIRQLNAGAYRFSVEWAKIEPREGVFDRAALEHYLREVKLLREAGIEPVVTLQHFTLPNWLAKKGGFGWEGTPRAFVRYTERVYREIGPYVRDWITLNEPTVLIAGSYLSGKMPPGINDVNAAKEPALGMLRSHALAYARLHRMARAAKRQIRVGIAHHLRVADPESPLNPMDRWLARVVDDTFNWSFPEAIHTGKLKIDIPFFLEIDEEIPGLRGTQDFFGMNYYTRDMVRFTGPQLTQDNLRVKQGAPVSDMGWEIYPLGFYRMLRGVHSRYPRLSILVTENGIADSSDRKRGRYLRDHLSELHRAMSDGVPVEGYCHWSLMDNFEWAEGFKPRFGLYEVNYATQRRTLRESGRLFSEVARSNALRVPGRSRER